jgi:hypothetical protein
VGGQREAYFESPTSSAITSTDLEFADDAFNAPNLFAKPPCRPQIPVVRNHALQANNAIFYGDSDVSVVKIPIRMQGRFNSALQYVVRHGFCQFLGHDDDRLNGVRRWAGDFAGAHGETPKKATLRSPRSAMLYPTTGTFRIETLTPCYRVRFSKNPSYSTRARTNLIYAIVRMYMRI